MRKNTIISSFRKIPAGFLTVAVLALLTESFVYLNRPNLIDDYWNKFLINEHNLLDLAVDYDYLIIGDSIQKTGINPTLVSDKILNLGLPGGKPLGLTILLSRYLEKHQPPKMIFLFIDPEDPLDSLLVILRYLVSVPEFISIWRDLTWRERGYFILRYWATLDMRKVNLVKRDEYLDNNRSFIDTMIKNRGYMPSPRSEISIENDYFSKYKERYQEKILVSKIDMKYLDKFIKLASSKNIKVVFLGIILPKELYAILERSGFNNEYRVFIETLKERYPGTYFVKQPILYLDNRYFGDIMHLNKDGFKIYTEYFKREVFIPLSSLTENSK